jgi:hypothetical protein
MWHIPNKLGANIGNNQQIFPILAPILGLFTVARAGF